MSEFKKWKIISEQIVFKNSHFIEVTRQQIRTNNDLEINDFWQVLLPNFCIALAITQEGKIITLREYKHGARKWGLSFPAGHIEAGELPIFAMQRELREETGYAAGKCIELGSYVANANQICGRGFLFLLTGCYLTDEPNPDLSEEIFINLLSRKQVEAELRNQEALSLPQLALWGAATLELDTLGIDF
jgi:ADP-ribose pyrophosphatase